MARRRSRPSKAKVGRQSAKVKARGGKAAPRAAPKFSGLMYRALLAAQKSKPRPSKPNEKRRALERAKERATVATKLSRAASQRYGRASKTAEGIRLLSREAQREAQLARTAKTVTARKKHAAAAGRAVEAQKATLYGVRQRRGGKPDARRTRKLPERGKGGPRGWKEYRDFDPRKMAAEGHHLEPQVHRMSAGALLSYLENRPGVRWPPLATRRLRTSAMNTGKLSREDKDRAKDVVAQLGLGQEDAMDLYEMLAEAEMYGLELDFEIGGYTDEG